MSSWTSALILASLFFITASGKKCFHSTQGDIVDCTSEFPLCGIQDGFRACVGTCPAELLKDVCHGDDNCCCSTDYCNTHIPNYADSKISCFHSRTGRNVTCSSEYTACGIKDGLRACVGECTGNKPDFCYDETDCCCDTNYCNVPAPTSSYGDSRIFCFHSNANFTHCTSEFGHCGTQNGFRACVENCGKEFEKERCDGPEDCCCGSDFCNIPGMSINEE